MLSVVASKNGVPIRLTDERWVHITAELGGTISGEHGIGHKRKGYMRLVMSPVQIDMMRGIKRALDPKNVLNPGKIFD